jgi:DNA invertase Pin-like site-specific DNA recombinase
MKYCAPHEIAAEIRAAKWAGKSLTDLEAEFDISRSTAVRYTRGVTSRAKAGREVQYDHSKILKLLEQSLSQTVISERLGISRAQVYRICKRTYGVGLSELPALLARMQWKAAA